METQIDANFGAKFNFFSKGCETNFQFKFFCSYNSLMPLIPASLLKLIQGFIPDRSRCVWFLIKLPSANSLKSLHGLTILSVVIDFKSRDASCKHTLYPQISSCGSLLPKLLPPKTLHIEQLTSKKFTKIILIFFIFGQWCLQSGS